MASVEKRRACGLLAQFDTPKALYEACETVRDAGYTRWDAHSPFPVHGLDKAMGLRPTGLPWIVFALGVFGATFGLGLQWWVATQASPQVIASKPLFSWQAFVPVTFELMVLFAALGAVVGMLALNRLPRVYHWLFRSRRFMRVTTDTFFISIDADDPRFDREKTAQLLSAAGATHVELVEAP